MRYGVDLDECLVDFNTGFMALIKRELGLDLPPVSDTYPDVWDYHVKAGVTPMQNSLLWKVIKDGTFWLDLGPLPGAEQTLELLSARRFKGDAVYFITGRPGAFAKLWTEYWLRNHGFSNSTVCIVDSDEAKGQLAAGLRLDVFVDDKPGNCREVVAASPRTRVYLVDAPYNRDASASFTRVRTVEEALVYNKELRVAA